MSKVPIRNAHLRFVMFVVKFEFWRNVMKVKRPNYQTGIYNECTIGKSDWICKSGHNSMSNSKMPVHKWIA